MPGPKKDRLIGQTLGEFKILQLIGAGGMGRVYLAEQAGLERQVAVKVLPQQIVEDEAAIERFQREAKVVAKLTHPNIAQVYSIGSEEDIHYVAMELVSGGDVAGMIKERGRVPIDEAATIIRQALMGVGSAHAEGIIHRDLKPQNLMVTAHGIVKVMDFGLARALSADSSLTASGAVLGTPLYMSPEQAEGKKVDLRTDIYALGATLYHMICGRPPFQGDTPLSTLLKHLTEPLPSPRDLDPDLPEPVCAIIHKMMAKQPEERYQTCEEVLTDLDAFREASGEQTTHPIRPIRPISPMPPSGPEADSIDLDAATSPARSYGDRTTWRDGIAGAAAAKPGEARSPRKRLALIIVPVAVLFVLFVLSKRPTQERPSARQAPTAPSAAQPMPPAIPAPRGHTIHALWPFTANEAARRQQDAAKALGLPVERTIALPDGEKMEFVLVPAGELMMGTPEDEVKALLERNKDDVWLHEFAPFESPWHRVRITTPFYIGKHEVTQGQWQALTGQNPSKYRSGKDAARRPAEQVSWNDIKQKFLPKLPDPQLPEGITGAFRLPTEAEWEYACRAGSAAAYCFGDSEAELGQYAWYKRNTKGGQVRHLVGTRKPNAWGLCDTHGNVFEWCEDKYAQSFYKTSPIDDPWNRDRGAQHVLRGGGFGPNHARSAWRCREGPNNRDDDVGFRLVIALELEAKGTPPPSPWKNSLGMGLVGIPAGEFLMGTPEEQIREDAKRLHPRVAQHVKSEMPQHKVRITRDFFIGKCEVTVGEFAAFVKATRYVTDAERASGATVLLPGGKMSRKTDASWRKPYCKQDDRHPVVVVTWDDAKEYCRWLNRTDTAKPDGWAYRLPTEAEIAYAARGPDGRTYPWGDEWDGTKCNFADKSAKLPSADKAVDDGYPESSPVGAFSPQGDSVFGVSDLAGNVWEWCEDFFDPAFYARSPTADPLNHRPSKSRVARCGGWSNDPYTCRTAFRGSCDYDYPRSLHGFRIALARAPKLDPSLANGCVVALSFGKDTIYQKGKQSYVRDLSGRGNDGQVRGAKPTEGVAGGALDFDGRDDWVEIPNGGLHEAKAITVATWVNLSSLVTHKLLGANKTADNVFFIASHEPTGEPGKWRGIVLAKNRTGYGFGVCSHSGEQTNALSGLKPVTGKWLHVAATFSDRKARLYVNGQRQSETPHAHDLYLPKRPLYLGRVGYPEYDAFLAAKLDEVAVWRRALSDPEVAALYDYSNAGQSYCEAIGEAVAEGGGPGAHHVGPWNIRFLRIPAGEFAMGSTDADIKTRVARNDEWAKERFASEAPQHKVRLSQDYFLSQFEVTVGQFRRFVEATNYKTEAESGKGQALAVAVDGKGKAQPGATWRQPGFEQRLDHPVVCVSWHDARAFCDWLNREDKQKPRGLVYRLPTEAEWECAAGGPDSAQYPWGNEWDAARCNAADKRAALNYGHRNIDDGHARTAPVGSYSPRGDSPFGLADMVGNVCEWCEDIYDTEFYQRSPTTNPLNLKNGENRVIRGDGWNSVQDACRTKCRDAYRPHNSTSVIGFRVALAPPILATACAEGCVLALSLDEGALYQKGDKTFVRDLSGSGFDGRVDGPQPSEGLLNGALLFDGKDDHVSFGAPGQLSLEHDRPFTLMAWVKEADGGPSTVFGNFDGKGKETGWLCHIERGKIIFEGLNDQKAGFDARAPYPFPRGTWQHIAITSDGKTFEEGCRIFLNAEFTPATAKPDRITGSIRSAAEFRVGGRTHRLGGKRYFFCGEIDEVAAWSRALSAEEIRSLYSYSRAGKSYCDFVDEVASRQ